MKKICIVFMIIIQLFFIQGCGSIEEQTEPLVGTYIYYLNTERTRLITKEYEPVGDNLEELIVEYIQMLERIPESSDVTRAKPDTVTLLYYAFGEDGQLQLHYDSKYYEMSGVDEVLYRTAVVKTLTQIEDIRYVEFYVNDQPLFLKGDVPVGLMKAEDFINNVGEHADYLSVIYRTVYFVAEDKSGLEEVTIKLEAKENMSDEELVLEALLKGPEEKELVSAIPEGTVVNSVETKSGVCYVDFNSKFLNKIAGVSGELKVYSVVNSLTELSEINAVQITIDGARQKKVQEVNISDLLERRLDSVKDGN